jgi:hypothetical protein
LANAFGKKGIFPKGHARNGSYCIWGELVKGTWLCGKMFLFAKDVFLQDLGCIVVVGQFQSPQPGAVTKGVRV